MIQVLNSSLPLLASFSPYETIACLHTLAKCGVSPPLPWLRAVTTLTYDQARLSFLLPIQDWMSITRQPFILHSGNHTCSHVHPFCIYSPLVCMDLLENPPQHLSLPQVKSNALTSIQLGLLSWSMGRLGLSPGKQWLDAICSASERCIDKKDGQV